MPRHLGDTVMEANFSHISISIRARVGGRMMYPQTQIDGEYEVSIAGQKEVTSCVSTDDKPGHTASST